jgi:hypothetical protein
MSSSRRRQCACLSNLLRLHVRLTAALCEPNAAEPGEATIVHADDAASFRVCASHSRQDPVHRPLLAGYPDRPGSRTIWRFNYETMQDGLRAEQEVPIAKRSHVTNGSEAMPTAARIGPPWQ